jgi:hypothetical protein
MHTLAAVLGVTTAILLVLLALVEQPVEQRQSVVLPHAGAASPAALASLTAELQLLKAALAQQQAGAAAQLAKLDQLRSVDAPAATAAAASAAPDLTPARVEAAERAALAACTEADVPILRLLHNPCPGGYAGYDCKLRWDVQDSFLPAGRLWLREWRATRSAVTNCQRGFFQALQARMSAAHWEVEWDAQPFRIAATPPRTIGKMLHQLAMVNYYHLTLQNKPRLRAAKLPGENYVPLANPGFRWNVLDYGGDNVIARPLQAGRRCAGSQSAWHCLWQRFPQQRRAGASAAPPVGSALAVAAGALYNKTRDGGLDPRSMAQYILASATSNVFTTPTPQLLTYMDNHLTVICHRPGPYCGGTADELATPVAGAHVRHGDSCDRRRDAPGPWNAMFTFDPKKNRLDRVSYRWCYSWAVYRGELRRLQQEYAVRTVLVATDDADGSVLREMRADTELNFVVHDFPRAQFVKRGWMEFRRDTDEHMPFSLAAEIELLSRADMLVGNMGSHVSRIAYDKMVASSSTSQPPPFISVDGYGMCCDFTEECTVDNITRRNRPIRECIYKYATCTGGDAFFYYRS